MAVVERVFRKSQTAAPLDILADRKTRIPKQYDTYCLQEVNQSKIQFSTWYGRCREGRPKIINWCSFSNKVQENAHPKTI